MGRLFLLDLEGKLYNCKICKTQLGHADDLVSKAFYCRRGKAYLFNNVRVASNYSQHQIDSIQCYFMNQVNITFGTSELRAMLSGVQTVIDVFCRCCGQLLGWKYEMAHENSQKYKEGKFVLERAMIIDGEVDSEFYIDTRASPSDGEDP